MRKYGGKIENLMEEALKCIFFNDFKRAEKLLSKAEAIHPNNIQVSMLLAEIAIIKEDLNNFNKEFEIALNNADEEIRESVYDLKISRMLIHGFPDEALEDLDKNKGYIKGEAILRRLQIDIYKDLGKFDELWIAIQNEITSMKDQSFEDIYIFIDWLNTAFELNKWDEISKIKNNISKLLKSIKDEDEIFIAKQILTEEYTEYDYVGRFREAEVYVDLLYKFDSKDINTREERKEIKYKAKLQKEIERMPNDKELIPFVSIKALELFAERYMSEESYDNLIDELPHDFIDEMKDMDEEIAFGIMRLKKRYQLVYKEFKSEWQDMFKRYTEGLNREMRRLIKKGKI